MSCAGLILAGGEGKRFGGPKAFARLPDRRTFLEACRDALAAGGARPVAATLPPGFTEEGIAGLRVLPLPTAELDMLASIRWGLRHLISDSTWQVVVVLPVDHPLIAADTVRRLAGEGSAVVAPSWGGRPGHPIALARDLAEAIARERLTGGSLREILDQLEVVTVPVDDPHVVSNCNTPDALKRALKVESSPRNRN